MSTRASDPSAVCGRQAMAHSGEKSHRVVCVQVHAPSELKDGSRLERSRGPLPPPTPSGHCGQEGVSMADHQLPGLCPWKLFRHVRGWDLGPSGKK